jgi:hypothetical protein
MIKIAPGTPVWLLLCSIVDYPGQLDVEWLTRTHYPWPAQVFQSAAEYRAYREGKAKHDKESRAKVSRGLSRLAEAGYVRTTNGVHINPVFLPYWERLGEAALCSKVSVVNDRGEIVGSQEVGVHPTALRIVRAVLAQPGLPLAALAEQTGGKSKAGNMQGAWTFQYEKLIGEGVICPPRYRWPTDAGVSLVQLHRQQAAAAAAPLV